MTSWYAHLASISVGPGSASWPASRSGTVGSTGNSTGPHLHFELRLRGAAIDPLLRSLTASLSGAQRSRPHVSSARRPRHRRRRLRTGRHRHRPGGRDAGRLRVRLRQVPDPGVRRRGAAAVAVLHAQRLRLRRGPDRRRAGERRGDGAVLARRYRRGGVRRWCLAIRHRARGRLACRPGHRRRCGSATQAAEGEGTFFLNQLGAELAPTARRRLPPRRRRCACAGEVFAAALGRDRHAAHRRAAPSSGCGWSTPTASRPRALRPRSPPPSDGTVDETAARLGHVRPGGRAAPRAGARRCGSSCSARGFEDDGPLGSGFWAAPDGEPAGSAAITAVPDGPVLENSFVSSKGWVKPGDDLPVHRPRRATTRTPPFEDLVPSPSAVPDGTTLAQRPPQLGTRLDVRRRALTARPASRLVLEAKADTLQQDPQIVWKDLSTTAQLPTAAGPPASPSHGPKVIPPSGGYETARYGDRPFPVVPVDFTDRAHGAGSSAGRLAQAKINDPETPGSTFNLYQEMSYGQLFPHGTVPSDGIATAGWDYEPGFSFTQNTPRARHLPRRHRTPCCRRHPSAAPARAHPRRLVPAPGLDRLLRRRRQGLGADRRAGRRRRAPGHRLRLRADRQGRLRRRPDRRPGDRLQRLRHRQGRRRRLLHDGLPRRRRQRRVADSRAALRQHLAALVRPPGRLRGRRTGEKGYVTDDQLTDLEGRPLFWTDEGAHEEDHARHRHPGPRAGRALQRQPRVGDREGQRDQPRVRALARPARLLLDRLARDLRLVDADGLRPLAEHRHRRQEGARLGRPARARARPDGGRRTAGRTPSATPTGSTGSSRTARRTRCTGAGVHNGEAYAAPLPGRQIIDPSLVPSGDHVWWSRSGNDFGCPPAGGHNLDIALPALRDVPAGTPVTLTFKSRWDVEWDYDYGFVLATTDNGRSLQVATRPRTATRRRPRRTRTPAAARPSTATASPARAARYEAGTQTVDRVTGNVSRRAVRGRQLRPGRPRRQAGHAPPDLRHRPRPGPARLVHRRPRRQGRRHR